ncbi:hypothetical protein Athai_04930 [Actinocatenispora thailandica]|uniref:Integral membrane protein n=1 Tax=Actinocatenispora thailandica TaxID=227318 RepID=A0A7R7DK37_9ACTN|nr:hypothetical protein [Actinocatenispora thailandica]BCJ32990.1 hypothetical protein Athai_04930 [Actinocatenispora thailandica]
MSSTRLVAALMVVEAVTFGVAGYLHLNGRIPLGFATVPGEWLPPATVAESLIGAMLLAAAVLTLLRVPGSGPFALGALGFGIVGVIVGLSITASGGRTADIAYHVAILAALIGTLALRLIGTRHPRPVSTGA